MPEMNSADSILALIQTRRSIRRYEDRPVPVDLIEKLLTAAIWAPSAHNRQPWRFTIMRSQAIKHRLALAMGDRLRGDLSADGVAPGLIDADVNRSYKRIAGAPALILVSLTLEDMDSYPDKKRQQNEWIMAVQSTAMAGQNLLLTAHAVGLGACWMCAPLFCPEVVRDVVDLPADWQPQGLITIGYPAERKTKSRRPLEDRANFGLLR